MEETDPALAFYYKGQVSQCLGKQSAVFFIPSCAPVLLLGSQKSMGVDRNLWDFLFSIWLLAILSHPHLPVLSPAWQLVQ